MNAVKGFFQKYGAVPAGRAGVEWAEATTPALVRQIELMLGAAKPYPAEVLTDLRAAWKELNGRWLAMLYAGASRDESLPICRVLLRAAEVLA